METEKLEKLEKFIGRLPEPEQKRVMLAVSGRTWSWLDILKELKSNGSSSSEIEKKIEERLK